MHLTQFKFLILSLLGFSMVVGIFNVTNTFASVSDPEVEYLNAQRLPTINLRGGETREITVLIKNTSLATWSREVLKLGTIYQTREVDRPSAWATDSWESAIRINADNDTSIKPLQAAEFTFAVTAPSRDGLYQEYFKPVLEHSAWLKGAPIMLTFRVGELESSLMPITVEKGREIRIDRATQQADLIHQGIVVATLDISSGAPGYTTPAGTYTIMNHAENAYSEKYKLWMPNWMALIGPNGRFEGYGLHGLPYWRVKSANYQEGAIYPGGRLYTQGRLYEGFEHLGTPVSHGCVRFGVQEVQRVYDWAENGTKVTVI